MLIKHYFLAGKQMKRQEITQLMLLMLKNCEGRNEGQDRTTLQPIHHRYVKFGLSEKRTKFEKIFLMVLTNQLIYLVKVKPWERFFQIIRASQKVRTLTIYMSIP